MRSGLEILADTPGSGPPVERHATYAFRIRMWLRRGDPVVWPDAGADHRFRVEEGGEQLYTTLCVDRGQMIAGLLHGVEGMHVGGTRRLRVAPHLGYAEAGVPGVIPPNALLTVEVTVVDGPEAEGGPVRPPE